MESFKVRVNKEYLTFCSAHFIVFNGSQCERLHGHNYRVAAELEGTLDPNFLVFDFIALKGILRKICDEPDHRVLVPMKSQVFAIEVGETSVRMAFQDREWIFPREDCCLLPIENTTAELLARWVYGRLLDEIRTHLATARDTAAAQETPVIRRIGIEVEESPGQCAVYEVIEPAL